MGRNPFAFSPVTVTVIATLTYLCIFIPLLVKHEVVPPAPSAANVPHGLNISEAWLDLKELTNGYHPFNSRRNDEVRNWLLLRIQEILDANSATWKTEISGPPVPAINDDDHPATRATKPYDAVVFNDLLSNFTTSAVGSLKAPGGARQPGQTVYFEGTNIIVYIRGTEDDPEEWWTRPHNLKQTHGKGGVLVNAHYDSVSTGFGATDDGIGVISILQLIKYFTTPGNTPKKGIVALFNNGEEDFLNGAYAYSQHPMSEFAYTFLNLEGAGAGGRATLFRTTDEEVTKAYENSPSPFGSVISADGFKSGAIRSQTDYVVFEGLLGLRGLDIGFWHPRQRYHTDQDDARHTSVDSLWHMLSAAVSTMKGLTSDTSHFLGPRGDGAKGKVRNGKGTNAVWFDLYGESFAVFSLRSLFAWSLVLLIVGPIVIFVLTYILVRVDKYYFFSNKASDDGEAVSLYGWRGAFRWPLSFIAATGLTFGSAYLLNKLNPLIIHSSQYAVWIMMLSLWFIVFWFLSAIGNAVRSTALQRGYSLMWMFLLTWAMLVAATVYEDRFHIAGVYFIVFFQAGTLLATLVALLELFGLPTKAKYATFAKGDQASEASSVRPEFSVDVRSPEHEEAEEPTENTPLIRSGDHSPRNSTTFATPGRSIGGARSITLVDDDEFDPKYPVYGKEQKWSGRLPTWAWIFEFLLLAPFNLVLLGQIGLLISFAVSQTGGDGSPTLVPYLVVAFFTTMMLMPLSPFMHRFTPHIPAFVALIFIGTLIYNLTAFPFSANNRYKVYFQQSIDLDSGINKAYITGVEEYVRPIVASLPSTAGQSIECSERPNAWRGLTFCSWTGLPPNVVPGDGSNPISNYSDWLSFNVTRAADRNAARFEVQGRNTRACVLRFARPVVSVVVAGGVRDARLDPVPEAGSSQVKLWHRDWDAPWTVDVEWAVADGHQPGDEGLDGAVVCLWSDDNTPGLIPALDELRRYAPAWAAISKATDGLVEGEKKFMI